MVFGKSLSIRRFFLVSFLLMLALPQAMFALAAEEASSEQFILRIDDQALEAIRLEHPALSAFSIEQLRSASARVLGFSEQKKLEIIEGAVVQTETVESLDLELLFPLLDAGLIAYLEPDYLIKPVAVPNDTRFNEQWALRNTGQTGGVSGVDINVESVWDQTTGSDSVVVGVIDTGVDYTHPDLAPNMWTNDAELNGVNGVDDDGNGVIDDVYGYNAYDDNGDPMDVEGHGTHCAGTIGAKANDNFGVAGVLWDVKIVGIKFLGPLGGTTSDAIDSINYAVNLKKSGVNLRVLSNSWGGGGASSALEDAIEAAAEEDILFVAAAGNDGLDNDSYSFYPANYEVENVVSVAAIDHSGSLAYFSNYGTTNVDLAAPGVSILSTLPGNTYGKYSGTSMATPHVSGAAALMLAADGNLSAAEIKTLLITGARPLDGLSGKVVSNGTLDVAAALGGANNNPPTLVNPGTVNLVSGKAHVKLTARDADGDALNYRAEINSVDSTAINLDTEYQFKTDGNWYQNAYGLGERWFQASSNKWFYILPIGDVYRYDDYINRPMVARLDASYYDDPMKLINAAESKDAEASLSLSGSTLNIVARKGFVGAFEVRATVDDGIHSSRQSFLVQAVADDEVADEEEADEAEENTAPTLGAPGSLVMLAGQRATIRVSVSDPDGDNVIVSAKIQNEPSKADSSIKVDGTKIQLKTASDFIGEFELRITASDGKASDSETVKVTVLSDEDPRGDKKDSDGDGVTDEEEYEDGSDPFDSGSYRTKLRSPAYTLWNSFLEMQNILELINLGQDKATVAVNFYDVSGALARQIDFSLSAGAQQDIILNNLPEFELNSYGIVGVEFEGEIDGRMTYYRNDSNPGQFEFAFAIPLTGPTFKSSVVGFNTFQPSGHPEERDNQVPNWLSVVNLARSSASFKVRTYDAAGELLKEQTHKVAGRGRLDLDGGHGLVGPNQVGMHQIIPENEYVPYIAQLIRYGSDSAPGRASGKFAFAFPLVARAGNGCAQHLPVSNRFGESDWVEIINTRDKTEKVTLTLYSELGGILYEADMKLAPHAQAHFPASSYLPENSVGLATVKGRSVGAIVAQSMFYFLNEEGRVDAMYGTQARESFGTRVSGSFNTFLGMDNYLRVSNVTADEVQVEVEASSVGGAAAQTFALAPHATVTVPVHQMHERAVPLGAYGQLNVTSSVPVLSELLRVRNLDGEIDFAVPTVVR